MSALFLLTWCLWQDCIKWNESIWKLYTLLHEAAKVLANCMVLCFSPFFKCEQIRFVNTMTRSYHLCYAITRLEKYINLQYKYQLHIQCSFLSFTDSMGLESQHKYNSVRFTVPLCPRKPRFFTHTHRNKFLWPSLFSHFCLAKVKIMDFYNSPPITDLGDHVIQSL